MNAVVDLQLAMENTNCPDVRQCEKIVQQVLDIVGIAESKECTIRIVDKEESALLNEQYRGIKGATNVLSFAFESPVEMAIDLMGDLVICDPLVIEQAKQQNKSELMHWTHLIVHGCLHLLGYDHIDDNDAEEMEKLECQIMEKMGYSNPYIMFD